MATYGFNSWNSWDPLKKCMVGSVYPAGWFSNYKDTRVADALSKVNEDTREDMLNLKGILESASVEVIQTPANVSIGGEPVTDVQDFMDKTDNKITKPLIAPRDELIVLGNTLVNASDVDTY